jgi:hypothetical protein
VPREFARAAPIHRCVRQVYRCTIHMTTISRRRGPIGWTDPTLRPEACIRFQAMIS